MANVSLQDQMIVDDSKELTDKHMLAAQQLLKQRFPLNHGFRDTLTLVNRREPEETPYIQILYVSNNHWITIAACNEKEPVEALNNYQKILLSAIKRYHGRSCIVKLIIMQLQKGVKDCGLFTITTATSLCFGDDDCVHTERPATASS